MSSGIKSARRDLTAVVRQASSGMNPQRHWMGCNHHHTQGKLRHGIPWTCAACVQKANPATAVTVPGSITNQQ